MSQQKTRKMPETLTPSEIHKQAVAEEIHDLLIEAWESDEGPHTLSSHDLSDATGVSDDLASQIVRNRLIPEGKALRASKHRALFRAADTDRSDRYQWEYDK